MNNFSAPPTVSPAFWHSLFDAGSVAVIGAKDAPGTWGYDAMKAVLDSRKTRPERSVYPVNPGVKQVLGLASHASILDIPGPVELAVIIVPATAVLKVMEECARKGVKAAVIVSAGFAEVGGEGKTLENAVIEITRRAGIRFVGPNCIGHADMHSRLASAAVAGLGIQPGPLGLLSQSGTLGAAILQTAARMGVGISKFVSTGNEADLRLEDYLEFLAKDDDTRVIGAYIEGLREGRRFFRLAKEITSKKPVVVIKSGATGQAAQAALSHTGALSGSDAVYAAAFRQTGVVRAEDEEELCDIVLALLYEPLPRGNRVGIITMGGGFGVVTAETCEKEGLRIPPLEEKTLQKLDKVLPPRWSRANPVDLVGIRPGAGDTTISDSLTALMEDNNIDGIISLLPPMVTQSGSISGAGPEQVSALLTVAQRNLSQLNEQVMKYGKPLLFVRRFLPPQAAGVGLITTLEGERIPEYTHPRRAARVMRSLAWYQRYLAETKG